jgi:hydrogenase maturation protein HypF
VDGKEYPVRRSRGYVPFPIKIKSGIGQVLACGAEQKASFSLSKDEYVFESQHIGDLKNIETLLHYEQQIKHFEGMFRIKPEIIACDLHPDYMSTEYAQKRAEMEGLPLRFIQHHHAHMASCMADNGLENDVIGIIWDGTGYGIDGGTWGGEFLTGNFKGFERAGSIRPIALPGGDKAVKDIYRIGYSLLMDVFGNIPEDFIIDKNHTLIETMLKSRINCPEASSMGRLFDGAAALIGIKSYASYEGQGAILLEAATSVSQESYSTIIDEVDGMLIYNYQGLVLEMVDDIRNGIEKDIICSRFMNSMIDMAVKMTRKISQETGLKHIVLSGGVFQNMYILKGLVDKLKTNGFKVYHHSRVSTNDEGISLGQAVIAAAGGGLKCAWQYR